MKKYDFYNEDTKTAFIDIYKNHNTHGKSDVQRTFWQSKSIEDKYDCDLSELNKSQLYEILHTASIVYNTSLYEFCRVYKSYMQYVERRPVEIDTKKYKKWLIKNCSIDYPLTVDELYSLVMEIAEPLIIRDMTGTYISNTFDTIIANYIFLFLGFNTKRMALITKKEILDGSFFEQHNLINQEIQDFLIAFANAEVCYIKRKQTEKTREQTARKHYYKSDFLFRPACFEAKWETISALPTKTTAEDAVKMLNNKRNNFAEFNTLYRQKYNDNRLDRDNLYYAGTFAEMFKQDIANKDYTVSLIEDGVSANQQKIKDRIMQYPISVGMSRETLKNLRQRYQIYKGQRLKQEGYKMILVDRYKK